MISPEEFANLMREANNSDTESGHMDADTLMLKVLRELGYGEGCDVFNDMAKWYA